MLKSGLQPWNRPRFSPTGLVRQAALLIKAVPRRRHVAGPRASIIAPTAHHEPFRAALFASDREAPAEPGLGRSPCQTNTPDAPPVLCWLVLRPGAPSLSVQPSHEFS